MAYYNVPILSNYLIEQGIVVKLKDSNFTQGQVTNPEARCPRSVGYRSVHSLASFLRRLSSLLTVFCTQIIRTSIIEMHECKKLTPRSCKLKLEVTEACLNGPKSACCRGNVTNLQRAASASLGGDIQGVEQV